MKKLLCFFAFCILTSLYLVSCSSDDYEDPKDEIIEEGDKNSEEDISRYVTVSVEYSNYSWNISIRSSLDAVYEGKYIKYGILCGYNGEPYYYTKYFTSQGNSINSVEPLFLDADGSPYIEQYFYWRSLVALQEKSSLTASERSLKNTILNDFRESEPEAKSLYWGQIFVEIDGKHHTIKEFGNKRKESGGSNNGGNNNNNGGSSSYEKPDVGFYDFTATKSSLKVQYKIYNKEKAGVSNAKIYYGTTSNPSSYKSATVSGTIITANITGLKAGTTYYVKCVVTGKGGTTTTTVTKCVTNYQ